MLDKLTKTISIGTIILILLGVFNLQQRYFWFELKIFDFVEASEILLSFSDIVMTIFFVLIVISIFYFMQIGTVVGNLAVTNPNAELTATSFLNSINLKKVGCVTSVVVGLATVGWVVLVIAYIYDLNQVSKWNSLWYDGTYIGTMVAGIIGGLTANTYKGNGVVLLLFSVFTSLIIMFAIKNYFAAALKLSGVAKYHVELTFDDGSMMNTTKNRIYIDQSRNFIFFRELESGQNIIIPLDNVKSIRMDQLHEGL